MSAYRQTIQKNAVMKVMLNERTHLTAEQVLEAVHKENPSISRSTVFRVLNQLSDRGDILRIRVADGADYYDFQTHPHYHVKCVECGEVCDIDMPIKDITKNIEDTHGYKILDHYVMFSGICPKCQAKEIK